MALLVVDPDVLSYLFKGDSRGGRYKLLLEGHECCVSFMAVAELERWALSRRWGLAMRERLEASLSRLAICYPDRDLCRLWALTTESASRAGRPISCADAWTAAVALYLASPLVTNNPGDFLGVSGLEIRTEP